MIGWMSVSATHAGWRNSARRWRTVMYQVCWRAAFFFFQDTAPTELYTLSLPDALPISAAHQVSVCPSRKRRSTRTHAPGRRGDRKSPRLNSSHGSSSYDVFCLKKKTVNTKVSVITGRTICEAHAPNDVVTT